MLTIDDDKAKANAQIEAAQAGKEKQAGIQADIARKRDEAVAADGGVPTTNPEAQFGRCLAKNDVIRKLRKLNPLLHFEVSKTNPSQIGIYQVDFLSNPGGAYRGLKFICGMENAESPEFTIRKVKIEKFYNEQTEKVDQREIFAGEVRGWRTVLARLIRAGLIGQQAAEREFNVTAGRSSENWKRAVN